MPALLKTLLAVALFGWLLLAGKLNFGLLQGAHVQLHVLGCALLLTSMLLQSLRWSWLMADKGLQVGFLAALKITWVASFIGTFLPGALGMDVVRAMMVAGKAGPSRAVSMSTVLWDRAIGLYALLWVGAAPSAWFLWGAPAMHADAVRYLACTNIALLFAASALLLAIPYLRSRSKLFQAKTQRLLPFFPGPRAFCRALALALVPNIIDTFTYFVAGLTIGSTLSADQVFLVGPLLTLANSLPLTPGGIGVGEASAALLFAQLGEPGGAMIMLITRLWSLLLRLAGGAWWVVG